MEEKRLWEKAYLHELAQAENARSSGNEGMARVCARRAAGIIIGEYFARLGIRDFDPSAYERIKHLRFSSDSSKDVQEIADHLMQRVNTDYDLPIDVDLIAEARQLADTLLYYREFE